MEWHEKNENFTADYSGSSRKKKIANGLVTPPRDNYVIPQCDWTIFLGGQNKLHNGRVVRSDTDTSTFISYYQTLIRPRRITTSHHKKAESKNCFFHDLLFNHHRSP